VSELTDPRQVVLVTARCRGKDNIIALAWHTQASFSPHLYTIFVGHSRHTHGMIKEGKVFCVNFMPYKLSDEVEYCGTHSGRRTDKFSETKLEKEECNKIDCCRIKQALAYMECRVVDEIEVGDHTMFVGEAVETAVNEKDKRIFQLLDSYTTTIN
jgi:flavin reductase (DIM6/NTAB) family NADH-FMN oxidoreductase RutF